MPALNSGSIRGGLGKFPKAQAILEHPFEHLLYAEGDSWFDEFTPFLHSGHRPAVGPARAHVHLKDLSATLYHDVGESMAGRSTRMVPHHIEALQRAIRS